MPPGESSFVAFVIYLQGFLKCLVKGLELGCTACDEEGSPLKAL